MSIFHTWKLAGLIAVVLTVVVIVVAEGHPIRIDPAQPDSQQAYTDPSGSFRSSNSASVVDPTVAYGILAASLLLAGTFALIYHRLRRRISTLQETSAAQDAKYAGLRQSEAQYRTLFESTTDAVMLLDQRGFFECNEATLRVFGCKTRDQFIACHPSELSTLTQPDGRDSRTAADERIQQAYREGMAHFRWRHQRLNGNAFPADVMLTRIDLEDRAVLLALVRDITEQKSTEDELLASMQQSRRANAIKTMFLANISHELRTPLHAILSFGSLATRKIDRLSNQELLEYFRLIDEHGQELLALIDDLLDLSTLEASRAEMVFRQVDMTSLLLNVIDECQSETMEKNVNIRLNDSDSTIPLVCDQARVKQVIRNLLHNAVQFSHFGGTVQVVVTSEEDSVVVAVADRGVGIPEDELKTIFDKFVQSSKTRSGAGGTGLGLAICREIILAHGGEIWAENRPEGGAIVSFRLPKKSQFRPTLECDVTTAALTPPLNDVPPGDVATSTVS
ncbi:MAG: PAS domain S-box protein [Pirellulales bacterium]|nr:PAS domain S-box protein [Pirellulales bacterium]